MGYGTCWILHIVIDSVKGMFPEYFTYFVPVFKYCYSDNRNLWTVMRAGGLARFADVGIEDLEAILELS
jgi:hypothetical protein